MRPGLAGEDGDGECEQGLSTRAAAVGDHSKLF